MGPTHSATCAARWRHLFGSGGQPLPSEGELAHHDAVVRPLDLDRWRASPGVTSLRATGGRSPGVIPHSLGPWLPCPPSCPPPCSACGGRWSLCQRAWRRSLPGPGRVTMVRVRVRVRCCYWRATWWYQIVCQVAVLTL